MSNLLKTRNEVYGAMKSIMDLSTRSADDLGKYDALESQYVSLTKQIESEVRFDSIKASMDATFDKRVVTNGKTSNDQEIRSAFLNYVRSGDMSEIRNINSFTNVEGGINVPVVLFPAIEKALAENSVMRRIGAKVITTTSTTNLPLANTAPTAVFTAQNPSGSYTDTPQLFGSATLSAFKLTALLKISDELLQDASTDLEATVAANVGTAFGNAEEIAFVSGSGAGQPLGLFRTTTAGGNAALTQNLGSASGSILDPMIDGYYRMPGNRRQEAVWIVGDGLASAMRKVKANTAGTYLWETSAQLGQPDTFLGCPVYTTFAASATWQPTAGVIGALLYPKHYVIGDRGGYQFQRLNELFAQEGNIGYRATKRFDSVLLDGNSLVKFISNVA